MVLVLNALLILFMHLFIIPELQPSAHAHTILEGGANHSCKAKGVCCSSLLPRDKISIPVVVIRVWMVRSNYSNGLALL